MSDAYRESARRDPDPVQSLRVAATLADRYRVLVSTSSLDTSELELAIGEAQQIYPEIWRHLEDARTTLVAKGLDVRAFDQLRGEALRTLGVTDVDHHTTIDPFSLMLGQLRLVDVKTATFNVGGYQLSVAACRALMAQLPEVDWAGLARAEDNEIRSFGSLRSGRWLSILKWLGVLAGVAVAALVIHRCATSRSPSDPDEPSPSLPDRGLSDEARVYAASLQRIATLRKSYAATCDRETRAQLAAALRAENRTAEASKLEQTPCVPARPGCDATATSIAMRQAEAFELSAARATCHGALIAATGQRTGLVIAVSGMVDRERVVIRGIVSPGGEPRVPFASSPENAELAGVADLDGDEVDELVMTGARGFIISRIEGAALRDIVGPTVACEGRLDLQRDFRKGRDGSQRRPVLTVPDQPLPKNCPKPGLHYYRLVGDKLVEDEG